MGTSSRKSENPGCMCQICQQFLQTEPVLDLVSGVLLGFFFLTSYSPFKSEPIIALINYQKLDKDSDVVIDYSQNKNELILLNTKDFEKIEITYSEKIKLMDKIWYCITENT